jgi:hypothetical protein
VVKAGPRLEGVAQNRVPVEGRVYRVAAVDGAVLFRTGNLLVRIGK